MLMPFHTFPTLFLRIALTFLLAVGLLMPARLFAQVKEPPQPAAVAPTLERQLAASAGEVSFLVVLREQLTAQTLLASAPAGGDRIARSTYFYEALTAHAKQTQAELWRLLDEEGVRYRPFYIVNMVEVEGDAALAARLQNHPAVAQLVANPTITQALAMPAESLAWLQPLDLPAAPVRQSTRSLPWGLVYTGAAELWEQGITGAGIVVASQDTGVEWDHLALLPRYRGWDAATQTADHRYSWHDAWTAESRPPRCSAELQTPCDDHGHGSHTVGTMVGNATVGEPIVGMAPEAEWIGCRNMEQGIGTPASYIACFEFFLAPYPQGGDPMTDGRPELAPHIINNSWGCPSSEGCSADTLRQVVEIARAAGQFVVASAGNEGAMGCESVIDPISIYDATFSIGAHDANGSLASFSSRGPVTIDGSGRIKPDLAAPGMSIYSTWVNGRYLTNQGTSMAAPHVAGAVALLWSAVPELVGQSDLTEQILVKSATPVNATICNTASSAPVPNNLFGFGRLNVARALRLAELTARVELLLRDAAGAPLAAELALVDTLTGLRYDATADATGTAVIESVYAGTYRLEIQPSEGAVVNVTLEVLLGESYGPRLAVGGAGETVTYSVLVPSVTEYLAPKLFLPLVVRE